MAEAVAKPDCLRLGIGGMANSHSREQQEFIIRRLAAFETPLDICRLFALRFPDTKCTEGDIVAADPRITILAPELHTLFASERKRVLDDPDAAPFAEQRARLIVLSNQARIFQESNRPAEVREVFRQIAAEQGIGVAGKGKTAEVAPEAAAAPIVAITRTIIDPARPPSE